MKYILILVHLHNLRLIHFFQLTDGNIGRITALLSEQKGVSWIKDISNKAPTEYEKCLHKIELDIIVGKYQIARNNLSKF